VDDSLHIVAQGKVPRTIQPGQVQVERDPTTGRILRVVRPASPSDNDIRSRRNPLNDPLNDISDSDADSTPAGTRPKTSRKPKGIVGVLEAQADAEASMPRKQRHQSKREGEWVARLVEKHGGDFRAMSRDRRLNVMQQSEGDLRRRVGRWMEGREEMDMVG
jgi:nucleolar protein 16